MIERLYKFIRVSGILDQIKTDLLTNLSEIDFSLAGTTTKINLNVGKAKRQLIDMHKQHPVNLTGCTATVPPSGHIDWDLVVGLSAIKDPAS